MNLDARADSRRSELSQDLNEIMLGSVAFNIRLSIRQIRLQHKRRMDAKLKKLSIRQDWPLKEQNFDFIRILNISLATFIKVLSYGSKHPIRDIFIEVHFLADIYKMVRTLQKSGTDVGKLCEIDVSAKWYAKNVRETPANRGIVKVAKLLKDNEIVTVPFDKGTGFCVMKRQSPC